MKAIDQIAITLGYLILIWGVVVLALYLIYHARKIIDNQTKIKCLCKHEYNISFVWIGEEINKYELKCRKCGKEKIIRIYKDGFIPNLEVADSE